MGARDLPECLVLQLRQLPRSEAQLIAIMICKQHLELLAKRDLKKLMAVTGADDELVKRAQTLIVALEPKPGRPFYPAEANIVVPDVMVLKSGRNWKVVLNPDVMPKLRINDLYAQAIRGQRNGSASGLSARLQEARWLLKSLEIRHVTLMKVARSIVERQVEFLEHGDEYMKPMILRDIAEAIGMHESTVSRVTANKYMATSRGIFELKYFFTSSIASSDGGEAHSAEAVQRAARAGCTQVEHGVFADDATRALLQPLRGGLPDDVAARLQPAPPTRGAYEQLIELSYTGTADVPELAQIADAHALPAHRTRDVRLFGPARLLLAQKLRLVAHEFEGHQRGGSRVPCGGGVVPRNQQAAGVGGVKARVAG